MDKNEMIELIGVKNVENLGFLPENVRKEIVELKVKIDAAYELLKAVSKCLSAEIQNAQMFLMNKS